MALQSPLDLETPKSFHGWWYEELLRGRNASDILEALSSRNGDIPLARQFLVAYHACLSNLREELLEKCTEASDLRVRLYAKAMDSYFRIARYQSTHGVAFPEAKSLRPGLERDLELLETKDSSLFAREVCCAIQVAVGAAYIIEGNHKDALAFVSNARYWAERLKAPYCIERAKTLNVALFGETNQPMEALAMLGAVNPFEEVYSVSNHDYNAKARAFFVSQLGGLDEAVATLEGYGGPRVSEVLGSELQRIKLLWAVGEHDSPLIISGDPTELEGKFAGALQHLLQALALPDAGHSVKERKTLFEAALEPWAEPRQPWSFSWARFVVCWIKSFANLHLDRPDLAFNNIEWIAIPSHEALDLRLLQAGINLEIGLHLKQPSFALDPWLVELRKIFKDARAEPKASPEGLAYRLMFWHPLAAAFAAVTANGVRELSPAVDAILQAGVHNRVYDFDLPPSLAAELALRSIGYAQNPNIAFVQADVGRDRKKRSALQAVRREYTYYRPAYSAVSLIYGLVKLGDLERAKSIYSQYGVVPRSNSDYEMFPLLEGINTCVEALLREELTVESFSFALLSGEPELETIASSIKISAIPYYRSEQ